MISDSLGPKQTNEQTNKANYFILIFLSEGKEFWLYWPQFVILN